jgi:riboflavin synthase
VFTGLVEETGTIARICHRSDNRLLVVRAEVAGSDARIGDSICVSGCCLTIVELGEQDGGHLLSFELVPETLQRTTIGQRSAGESVNLERALRADSRLGGHWVTGHVDGTGTIESIDRHEEWSKIRVTVDPALARQMAAKGSVAVEGVSLTLVDVGQQQFSVVLVPHTLATTTLGRLGVGDHVNVETDLLAKYVQRQLEQIERWPLLFKGSSR